MENLYYKETLFLNKAKFIVNHEINKEERNNFVLLNVIKKKK